MAFENLGEKLGDVFKKLKGKGKIMLAKIGTGREAVLRNKELSARMRTICARAQQGLSKNSVFAAAAVTTVICKHYSMLLVGKAYPPKSHALVAVCNKILNTVCNTAAEFCLLKHGGNFKLIKNVAVAIK